MIKFKRTLNEVVKGEFISPDTTNEGYFQVKDLEEQPKEIIVKETNRESGKEIKKKARKKKDV